MAYRLVPTPDKIKLTKGYLSFIVAMPAIKDFIAAWGSNATPPPIVQTPGDEKRCKTLC
jgi:hypothetical protein